MPASKFSFALARAEPSVVAGEMLLLMLGMLSTWSAYTRPICCRTWEMKWLAEGGPHKTFSLWCSSAMCKVSDLCCKWSWWHSLQPDVYLVFCEGGERPLCFSKERGNPGLVEEEQGEIPVKLGPDLMSSSAVIIF